MSSIIHLPGCYGNTPWPQVIEESHNPNQPSGYTHTKYLTYTITLYLNHILSRLNALLITLSHTFSIPYKSRWAWWNPIITHPTTKAVLYLSGLPLTQTFFGKTFRNDADALKDLGIDAVLSVTEPFENTAQGFFLSAVTPEDWKQRNITHLQLSTPDFGTITREKIDQGVAFIDWNMRNGKSVLVHCKAGRGRSALIELCYLMKHQSMSAEKALETLQENRPQVGLEKAKWDTAKEYESSLPKKEEIS